MSLKKFPLEVLFDTNILIAAFLTEGLCQKLLRRAAHGEIILFTCPYILNELKEKLAEKGIAGEDIMGYLDLILMIAKIVDPEQAGIKVQGICRNSTDDPILAAAVVAKVEYLITGDPDLLELKEFQGIRILRPKELEEKLF